MNVFLVVALLNILFRISAVETARRSVRYFQFAVFYSRDLAINSEVLIEFVLFHGSSVNSKSCQQTYKLCRFWLRDI